MRHEKAQDLSGYSEISVELGLTKATTGKCSFTGLFENPQRSRSETLVLYNDCEVRYVLSSSSIPSMFQFAQYSVCTVHNHTSKTSGMPTVPKKYLSSQAQHSMCNPKS